jgi:hypothetical protein
MKNFLSFQNTFLKNKKSFKLIDLKRKNKKLTELFINNNFVK